MSQPTRLLWVVAGLAGIAALVHLAVALFISPWPL